MESTEIDAKTRQSLKNIEELAKQLYIATLIKDYCSSCNLNEKGICKQYKIPIGDAIFREKYESVQKKNVNK